MNRTLLMILLLCVSYLVVLFSLPVHAEPQNAIHCFTHDEWQEKMHAPPRWDIVLQGVKLDNLLLEVWGGPKGEWISVWVWPSGQTCPMEVGGALIVFGQPRGDAF